MTIYDISEKAGVSIATVSRVLNGSNRVSEKTRQKVLTVMKEYDYTPNAFARGLGLNTMNTIGILCVDSSNLYFSKALYYMEQQLHANQYDSLLFCTGYDLENRQKSLNLLLSKKVDGIILVGSDFISETKAENQYIIEAAKEVPIMLFDAALDCPNVYSIVSDDFLSVYKAASSLLSSGVKDILFFYNSDTYSNKQKLSGYRTALRDAGINILPSLIQLYNGDHENISAMVQALQYISKSGINFDGVIASDDTLAVAALKYAKCGNLKVPEDFSVIGYGNSLLATCCDPELTSIDNNSETLCTELINTLLEVFAGNTRPSKTLITGKLNKRNSTNF